MALIDDLFEQFIRYQKVLGKTASTIRGYEYSFRVFRSLMPGLEIHNITEERVIDFYEKLRIRKRVLGREKVVQGITNSTLCTYRNKLGSYFNWLLKKKYAMSNPFKETPAPKIVERGRKYLTQKEIKKILWAVGFDITWKNNFVKTRNIAIIYMALFAGLRKGELLGLKVKNVDMLTRIINIRGDSSKSKRERNISINPELYKHLEYYLEERQRGLYKTPYLFVSDSKDTRFTVHGLAHTLQRIVDYVGFKFHMHQFRHTFAVNISYTGQDIYVIQNLLGHADIRMTSQYLTRFPSEHAKNCVDRLLIDDMI